MFGNCLQVRASAWSQYSSYEGVLGQELFCARPRKVITARGTVATPQRGFSLAMLSTLARGTDTRRRGGPQAGSRYLELQLTLRVVGRCNSVVRYAHLARRSLGLGLVIGPYSRNWVIHLRYYSPSESEDI
jgi:hypothetical protein